MMHLLEQKEAEAVASDAIWIQSVSNAKFNSICAVFPKLRPANTQCLLSGHELERILRSLTLL